MKSQHKLIWKVAIITLCMVSAYLLLVVGSLDFKCVNEVISETLSPDGSMRVVVFERSCGATTGFSTQVSILPSSRELNDRGGNVFVSDTNHGAAPSGPGGGPEVSVVWQNSTSLVLRYHPKARVFLAENQFSGIHIQYDTSQ